MRGTARTLDVTKYLLLLVGAVTMLTPLAWMVLASFKTLPEILAFPPTFLPEQVNLDNYRAVFETAELVRSAGWMRRLSNGPRLKPTRPLLLAMLGVGFAMAALSMSLPGYFYPFLWGSAFFLAEPVNAWLGRPSLLGYLGRGDWRPVVALALGALVCGFLWELWNFYSYPKWTYHTPGVEFLHVFEMPLLGFLGYPPFGLELYALAHLIAPRPPRLRL